MRQYIDIIKKAFLTEADKPKKTATRDTDKLKGMFEPKADQPIVPSGTSTPPSQEPDPSSSKMPGKTMSGDKARQKAAGAEMSPEAGEHLGQLMGSGARDEISDEEAAQRAGMGTPSATAGQPKPANPENLPAVVSNAITQQGMDDFDPEWIQVKHLPGYLQQPIRALGRGVFGQFTDTAIEDIQVMCTMTNPEMDVKKMFAFIKKNGVKDDSARIDFSQVMPGYSADTQLWRMQGYEFLLVKDMMGYYVYGWPGGRGVHLPAAQSRPRLK